MGPQRIYSNIVWEQPTGEDILSVGAPNQVTTIGTPATTIPGPGTFGYTVGDPNHGRYWDTAFETTGPRGLREIMVTRRRWDSARPNTWTS